MKKLLIVESPAKIKTISKFLGKEFRILSTLGHIVDLPPKTLGVSINDSVDIDYTPIAGKEKVIADISKAASTADEIYLAPDPDREGEIIAWHVEQIVRNVAKKSAKIYRISFNEITESAVRDSIENPRNVDMKKVGAQQARRVLDRLVGYEVSPILWKKVTSGLSAGRVQSVVLRLICDREEAIRKFKPEEYWSVSAQFEHKSGAIEAPLTHIGKKKIDIKNKKQVDTIVSKIKKESFEIEKITDKKRIKNPLPPFMTSTLQQAAFNRLGFTVKKTMQLAQQLYEGVPLEDPKTPVALITYMRTDSLRLSDTALKQTRAYVKKIYGETYLPKTANIYTKSKKGKKEKGQPQDAHEAIRPISPERMPSQVRQYLSPDLAKLYELIWKRCIASQMKPAEYAQRQVVLKGGTFTFKVTGSTLVFDGFLKVYNADEDEKEGKVKLPKDIKEKDPVLTKSITPKQHFTQPPPKYSEASLVKTMKEEGIGRPSTYSTVLSTIQARSYTTRDNKKRFTPTELGMAVSKLLVENLPHIMDVSFTAHMEEDLDDIARGTLERDTLIREFNSTFKEDLKKFAGTAGQRVAQSTDIECPKCKKEKLIIRFGKAGEFIGCPAYPDCKFTSNFERNESGEITLTKAEEPKLLEETCPKCGKQMRRMMGRYGAFIACSGYPDCKYIHQNKASFPCPQCGSDIVERKWRGGNFWGCKGYPKCKFAIFGAIEETPCPKCKKPFLLKKISKKTGESLVCSDKECGYNSKKSDAT